jgi:hypothetical protein
MKITGADELAHSHLMVQMNLTNLTLILPIWEHLNSSAIVDLIKKQNQKISLENQKLIHVHGFVNLVVNS